MIQKLLKSQSDLAVVQGELLGIWNCLDLNQSSLLVETYTKFLNEIWTSGHIAFFIQTHMVIDQVINGDVAFHTRGNLQAMLVKVERVVDIIQNLFKMSSAMSLLENTDVLEVPFAT